MPTASPKQIVFGITGASGAVYGRRLLDCLETAGTITHLIVSPNGRRLLADELGIKTFSVEALLGRASDRITLHTYNNIGAPIASGSFRTDGMVVCPCSTHTMAAMAAGLGDNLICRAAAVTLKEGRRLLVVPREMPLTQIDLHNALRLSQAGATICPPSPGFYMLPRTLDDLVDFVVGKLLDLLDVPHQFNTRWTGAPPQPLPPGDGAKTR
ncbi:MAG: UbiX family flavin prenyltransferase [bacterium]|nr:UbiX family flavin prenyltransferase [bacterium]